MSTDGPTLADDSYEAARRGEHRAGGHGHSHGPGHHHDHPHTHGDGHTHEHDHPRTPGQEAHAGSRRRGEPGAVSGAGHAFDLPDLPPAVDIFDTTLRDGSQQEGLSLTVDDKLRVAEQLDHLGVTFIEGGWPGANPKDAEFFARAPQELHLVRSTLVAFGSTRRAGVRAEDDEVLRHLVDAQTDAVCLVAKSSEVHVVDALRTTLDEAVAMVTDSIEFLRRNDRRVFIDAEHFFDGYKANPEFTLRILRAAEEAGAETLVLCDTNGGTLPYEVERIVSTVLDSFETQVGVHNVAALLIEPIQGEGGFIVPAEGFLPALSEWTQKNGVVFIADEIQSGFARTGEWFACNHEGVVPDMVTTAKGLAGGMPLAAVTGRAELMNAPHEGGLGGTYGGNPVAAAAALATIRVLRDRNLVARARELGDTITGALTRLQQDVTIIGDVRGRGAMVAMELIEPGTTNPNAAAAKAIVAYCNAHGVVALACGTYGNVIRLLPPLVITDEQLADGLAVLADAVRSVN